MVCKKCKTEINGALQDCPFCDIPVVDYKIKMAITRRNITIDKEVLDTYKTAVRMLKEIANNETNYKINSYKDAYFFTI